jgi:hypothetical protein
MIHFHVDEYIEYLGKYWMFGSTHYVLKNMNYDYEVMQTAIDNNQDVDQTLLKKIPSTWNTDNVICIIDFPSLYFVNYDKYKIKAQEIYKKLNRVPIYIIYCPNIHSKQQFFDLALKTLKLKAFQ